MDDYREGELHQCEELKRRLVYPAELEAQCLSERGEIALDECRRLGQRLGQSKRCRGGRMSGKDKHDAKNISPPYEFSSIGIGYVWRYRDFIISSILCTSCTPGQGQCMSEKAEV